MAADWAACLEALFASKGADELKASKTIKKAVKAAGKQSKQAHEALASELDAFLRGGAGGFVLQGSKIVRAAGTQQQHKKRKQKAAAEEPAATAAVQATPFEEPAKKKRKRKRDAEAIGGQPDAEQSSINKKKQKKDKQRKQQAAAEQQASEQQQQEEEEAEQQDGSEPRQRQDKPTKQKKAGKKRSRAADGGEGPATGDEDGLGDEPDTADLRWRANTNRVRVKSGAFSKAEKETLRKAVHDYAVSTGRSTEHTDWLYSTSKSGDTKGMWKKIAAALPHRTVKSVWSAGTRIFNEGNYQGRWTPEQDAQLLQLVSEKGRKWKEIGASLGRMNVACRDRWLMIRLGDSKKEGRWAEDEVQRLQSAVQQYLDARTAAEGVNASGGGGGDELTLTMDDIEDAAAEPAVDEDGAATFTVSRRVVLDDIDWGVVSQEVGTRNNVQCLEKWYTQLSPSMVARGEWGSGDDRRLLRSLYLSDAAHDYDLDWGQLVRGRTAAQTRRRWRLMLKVVPDHRDLEFREAVLQLVQKYTPQLLDRRRQSLETNGGEQEAAEQEIE